MNVQLRPSLSLSLSECCGIWSVNFLRGNFVVNRYPIKTNSSKIPQRNSSLKKVLDFVLKGPKLSNAVKLQSMSEGDSMQNSFPVACH